MTGAARNERDANLIAAFRAGDAAAMDELFAWYQPMALKYAIRYATELVPAEDIVSEAFLRMLQALRNGKGPTVSTWWYLATAMKSVAIDLGTVTSRVQPTSEDHLFSMLEDGTESSMDESAHVTVIEAFNRLPKRWQSVIWYRDISGYSVAETGDFLGLHANAVSALYTRARKAFRTEYLRAVAHDDRKAGCLSFAEALVRYGEAGSSPEAELDLHVEGCSSCRSKLEDLSRLRVRFASALLIAAPGLVFQQAYGESAFVHGLSHGTAAGDVVSKNGGLANIWTAVPTPAKWLVAGLSLLSVIGVSLMVPVMGSPEVAVSGDWGKAPSEQQAAAATALTFPEENEGNNSPTLLPLVAPHSDAGSSLDSCPVYFEQSSGSRTALFERRTEVKAKCRVELIWPNGDIVQLLSGPGSEIVQVTRAGTYFLRMQSDGGEPGLYRVEVSPEQVTRTE